MNKRYNIPDGCYCFIDADQWHEDGYIMRNNLICTYYEDRKDPQIDVGKGVDCDVFIADPIADEKAKNWLKELTVKYSRQE